MDTTEGTIAPSNVIINGQEFSPDEAQELIETGRKTREYEQKYSTKLDSVWPEYGRLSQERSSWAQKEQDYQKKLSDFESKQARGVETPADVQAARDAARKLGIVLDEDVKGKYVSKDELDTWYTERRQKERADEDAVKSVLSEADKLAEEINKSNPPVKFNKKAVLAYASAYGKSDLRDAYEEMNADELAPWKEAQLAARKSPSLRTLGPGGKKEPGEVKVTNDNVRELLRETLTRPQS
jgi:hypothetical protein